MRKGKRKEKFSGVYGRSKKFEARGFSKNRERDIFVELQRTST